MKSVENYNIFNARFSKSKFFSYISIKLMDKFKANMNSEQFVEPNKKLSKKNSSKILEKTQYLS